MNSCGPLHMDKQRQDDQLEPIYNNSVPIQDVDLKTYREQWTIESGRWGGSGTSMLMARHDDDDDDDKCLQGIFILNHSKQYNYLQIFD